MTEETDAVAIIVSEETGMISVAEDGKITRNLDRNTLQAKLETCCELRQEKKSVRLPGKRQETA